MDSITLNNTSTRQIAYRIKTSLQNLFAIKSAGGVLDPGQKMTIPVVLKSIPSGASASTDPLAKFSVEFLECEDEYYFLSSNEYWNKYSSGVVKRIVISKLIDANIGQSTRSSVIGTGRRVSFSGGESPSPVIRAATTNRATADTNLIPFRRRSSMASASPLRDAGTTGIVSPADAILPADRVTVLPLCLQFKGNLYD